MNKKKQPLIDLLRSSFNLFWKTDRLPFMLIMVALTAAILGWLIYRQRDLFQNVELVFHPLPGLLAFIFYSICLFQVGLIWSGILNELGGKAPFFQHFRFFCITLLGKRLPGKVWYIPWRAKMYNNLGISARVVALASGIELAVSVISGLLASLLFAIPVIQKYQAGIWIGIVLFGLCLLALHPQVIRRVGRLLKVELGQVKYRAILGWVGQYFLFWLVSGTMLFFVVNIIIPLDVTHLPFVIGVWSITGAISLSLLFIPSNFGFNEISISLLLSMVLPSPIAVIVAIGSRVLLFIFELAWGSAMLAVEYIRHRQITL